MTQVEAVKIIASERLRQQTVEGYDPSHDDKHDRSQLWFAARCYHASANSGDVNAFLDWWPWDLKYWKPIKRDGTQEVDKKLCLIKSGALIVAEMSRLDRALGKVVEELQKYE